MPDNGRIGLAVKAVTIHKSLERKNEPFWVVHAGTGAHLQDGEGVHAVSRVLHRIPRGVRQEFGGEGFLILPPMDVDGGMIAWHIGLWESDHKHREVGEAVNKATSLAKKGYKVAKKLTPATSTAVVAIAAVGAVARVVGEALRKNGDDLMLSWVGSLRSEDLEGFAGKTLTIESEHATVDFRVVTEAI